MSNVTVQKIEKSDRKNLPVFEEIEKRIEGVRRRAFELFLNRGRQLGHEIEDWIKAEHEVMGWPAAEMIERDGKFELELTLPGFDAKQVEVTATPSEIIVHAQYKADPKEEPRKVLWTEFGPNDVFRRFDTPQLIDVDKTHASLEKGILHVVTAKARVAAPKTIAIEST